MVDFIISDQHEIKYTLHLLRTMLVLCTVSREPSKEHFREDAADLEKYILKTFPHTCHMLVFVLWL